MKLSKALLQAVLVGASLQSCNALFNEELEINIKPDDQEIGTSCGNTGEEGNGGGDPVYYDCPACGMG